MSDNCSFERPTILRAIRYWLGQRPEMPAATEWPHADPAPNNLAGKWPDAASPFFCLGTINDSRERS